MKLSNSVTIDRPVNEVYDAFLDIERIAGCMPGSTLIGESSPGTYEGEVKVKVGPMSVAYTGTFTILEADEEARRLTLRAKGREKRGAGNADAHIVATLAESGGGTRVDIDTDLSIRGKVAQFGRGVIGDVTESIMQTFAGNVEQMLSAGGAPTPAAPTPAAPTPAATAPATGAPTAGQAPAEPAHPAAPQAPAAAAAAPPQVGELDAWQLIVKPLLSKHAGSIVTIALSGLAAYWGARAGARRAAASHRNN